MLHYARTLIWLKLHIFRHTVLKKWDKQLPFILLVIAMCFVVLLALVLAVALFFLGLTVDNDEKVFLGVMLGLDIFIVLFIFFKFISFIVELQRSEMIDFRKILYLPVSLPTVYILNFLISLVTPSLFLFVLPATGFIIGMACSSGVRMVFGVPILLTIFVLIASWMYFLRGFLAALMQNKRRRRFILTVVPLIFVLLCQIPNILNFTVFMRDPSSKQESVSEAKSPRPIEVRQEVTMSEERRKELNRIKNEQEDEKLKFWVKAVNIAVPLGWFPYSLYALGMRNYLGALLCMLGLTGITGLGLSAGYRSTVRYYTGYQPAARKKKKQAVRVSKKEQKQLFIERDLPLLSNETATMALASFLMFMRYPRIRAQLAMSLVMWVFLTFMLFRSSARSSSNIMIQVMPVGTMFAALLMMSFVGYFFNLFGPDREGFQALILLPGSRRSYMLGKNIAVGLIVILPCILFNCMVAVILKISIISLIVSLLQVFLMFLFFSMAGHFMSLWFPYPTNMDTLRGKGFNGISCLGQFLYLMLLPIIALPTAFCVLIDPLARMFGGYSGPPIGLIVSIVLIAVTIALYRVSLNAASKLLEQREKAILEKLLQKNE